MILQKPLNLLSSQYTYMARFFKKKGYPHFTSTGKSVHRQVAAKKVGGPIGRGRIVHHKDGNKSNFRRSNLRVMSRSQHSRLHARKRRSSW